MGSSSSKFRKHIQSGDEYAALHLYSSSSELRKALDPNLSYGDNYSHDTPMHMVARHAMKSLLRIFLLELGGNPNKKNARNETVLHCVCAGGINDLTYSQKQRRDECIVLVLQWGGTRLADGTVERINLAAKDEAENTALHHAATCGLQRCVELLVTYGAPLFVENAAKETPCDSAEKSGHAQIALYLESKMVFSNEDQNVEEFGVLLTQLETDEGYSGLRAQDLQEAKDQLLVETSDMLHVPLFTAEALLRNHEWSREMLLEAWIEDPIACCEKSGVTPPVGLLADGGGIHGNDEPVAVTSARSADIYDAQPSESMCDICACNFPSSEDPVPMTCDHRFCRSCWETYLTVKITEGETHHITCPGYQCSKLVPVELIEKLVSREMARRYLQFDIKAFVESNPTIKWCPYPRCGRAVRLPESDNPMSPLFRGAPGVHSPNDTSHAVDCGNGHIFCWECLGEAHEPASCENWKNWHQKISDIKPEELSGTEEDTETSANCLWLVTNSKPCPNCKSPIQKNEGCNHMKCSKCKYDFCWVCLEAWKKHSTATGGYFRCNRYEVVKKVEETHDQMKSEAEVKHKKLQELDRFVHYYSRFKNHENSYKLEMGLYETAKQKMLILARAVAERRDSAMHETKFVQEAVTQLLKARHVLKCSYVYGYYLEDVGYKKPIFEFMQTELEECTETLSEMVARPYLRTPRTKIVQTAHLVQRKRHELVAAIAKGLVPPDTSPAARKKSYRIDEDTRKALLASLQDDPLNPWVRDISSGRHPGIPALLDWPEASDESDSETASPLHIDGSTANVAAAAAAATGTVGDVDLSHVDLQIPGFAGFATCVRAGCHHRRAVNQLTGQLHDHCSIDCMRLDRAAETGGEETAVLAQPTDVAEFIADYQMDLLRALEMSRLQFLREIGSLRPGSGDNTVSPSENSPALSPRLSSSPTSSRLGHSVSSQLLTVGRTTPPTDGATAAVAAARSLGASPRPSTSSEMDASAAAMLAASTALKGHRTLNQELERAMEISRLNLQDEERQMCLAIALSIQDAVGSQLPTSDLEATTVATLGEHAAIQDAKSSGIDDPPPICQNLEMSVAPCLCRYSNAFSSASVTVCSAAGGVPVTSSEIPCTQCIRWCVNPPVTGCSGSTAGFDYGFPRPLVAGGEASIESVFEPRPPHPLSSPSLPQRSVKRCALAHDETVTVLDPWRRRPSSFDHGRPRARCVRSCCAMSGSATMKPTGSRRRRSCGTRLSHRDHTMDTGYLSDRAASPCTERGMTPPTSEDSTVVSALGSAKSSCPSEDGIDLVINSDILESMLQGTEGYMPGSGWSSTFDGGNAEMTMTGNLPANDLMAENQAPAETAVLAPVDSELSSSTALDDNDAVFV